MVSQEDRHRLKLADVQEGQIATHIIAHLEPIHAALKEETISKMMNAYRAGNVEIGIYLAGAAQLCTLEDMQTRLKARVNKGIHAAKEIL